MLIEEAPEHACGAIRCDAPVLRGQTTRLLRGQTTKRELRELRRLVVCPLSYYRLSLAWSNHFA